LAWERDNDSYTFTNQAVKYQKSTLASYQTSNNLYSGPFGGMENYFANIKTYFGQTKYDQMIEGFMRASILYMDTIKLVEWHIYGSSRIGIYETNLCMASRSVRVESGTETQVNSTTTAPQSYTYFTTARGAKRFELTNHLGNVLAVITDKKVAICSTEVFSHWKAELVSATDYSPFGATMPGRNFNSTDYRFGFNGKEKVDEVTGNSGDTYDYGARVYDARLGRFLSRDPLAKSYPFYSPYQFAANTPIMAIDLDGREVLIKISDIPNGTTQLRVIGSESVSGAPQAITVNTYPMTVTDMATGTTSTHSVTRDALYVNATEVPDAKGNIKLNNIPFEPKTGSSNKYIGEERKSFGSTELPSLRLTQGGSTTLPAEPVNSPWRADKDNATNINIHVGGQYTTSKTPPGYVNVTGSEGCFTVVGGNAGINALQSDIDNRQQKLQDKKMSTEIQIEVIPRASVPAEVVVPATP
jgi:RHS repeat-associated protein